MAAPNRLRELEQQYGDLHKVIPKLATELGQKGAAERLEVSQSFISQWLAFNGYALVSEYRKVDQQPEVA